LDRERIERIIENKYSLLLFFLVILLAGSAFTAHNDMMHYTVGSLFAMVVFIIMLKILRASRLLFAAYITLSFLALLLHYLAVFVVHSKSLGTVAIIVYILMIGILIVFMTRRIFSERLVTGDTIKGGISVYIMMGTWWQMVYQLLWMCDPRSFLFPEGTVGQGDFLYYSISTITCLGFGDILPRSYPAKLFSVIEALVGQLYVAVFVARLVGLHVAVHARKHNDGR